MGMADRIKERRIAMNFTQEELAQKLGLQKSAIAKYEKGRVENIKRSIIEKMSELLDCSPVWLMGYDMPMDSKITPDQAWDEEAQRFDDKINAFYYQLKGLGWSYEWSPEENLYTFSNKKTSIKVTADEYSRLVDETEDFCRKRLQKLLWKSLDLDPIAAHNDNAADPEQQELMNKDIEDLDNNW